MGTIEPGTSGGDESQARAEQRSRIEMVSRTPQQLIELVDMVEYLAKMDSEDPDKRVSKRDAGLLLDYFNPPLINPDGTKKTTSRWSSPPDGVPGKPFSFTFRIEATRDSNAALSLVTVTIYTNNQGENYKGGNPRAVTTVIFPRPEGVDPIQFELRNKMTSENFNQATQTLRDNYDTSPKPATRTNLRRR